MHKFQTQMKGVWTYGEPFNKLMDPNMQFQSW
jgi:hypothetical protein